MASMTDVRRSERVNRRHVGDIGRIDSVKNGRLPVILPDNRITVIDDRRSGNLPEKATGSAERNQPRDNVRRDVCRLNERGSVAVVNLLESLVELRVLHLHLETWHDMLLMR